MMDLRGIQRGEAPWLRRAFLAVTQVEREENALISYGIFKCPLLVDRNQPLRTLAFSECTEALLLSFF